MKTGLAEDFRAFVDGGPGREDVIDEDRSGRFLFNPSSALPRDGESAAEIFQPLRAGEGGLVSGGSGSFQGVKERKSGMEAKAPGDFRRLVEMTVLKAFAMEWNGNEWPLVLQRRLHPRV